jgi:hypothetical protein
MTPCRLVEIYRSFEGMYWLPLQSWRQSARITQIKKQRARPQLCKRAPGRRRWLERAECPSQNSQGIGWRIYMWEEKGERCLFSLCVGVETGWCMVLWEDAASVGRSIGLVRCACVSCDPVLFASRLCLNTLEMFTGGSDFYNPLH